MKKVIILSLLVSCASAFGQAIFSSSESKSGLIIGSEKKFATVNFQSESDKFAFSYKTSKQDPAFNAIRASSHTGGTKYPTFCGLNASAGMKVKDKKAIFLSDSKFKGTYEFEIAPAITKTKIKGVANIASAGDPPGVTHQTISKLQQSTVFLRFNDSFGRIKYITSSFIDLDNIKDSLILNKNDAFQNSFSGTLGFSQLNQWKSNNFFSWALSLGFQATNLSVAKLSAVDLKNAPTAGYDAETMKKLQTSDDAESYFNGKPESEFKTIPRLDLFYRHKWNDNTPIIGGLLSYSPIFSNLSSASIRNSGALGLTFGLPSFPDQILFAIAFEMTQDYKGEYKKGINMQLSFPIQFN